MSARIIAGAFAGLSPAALHAGYLASYWIQVVVVFAFLVLLPTGEHFHIVTALPALYFHRGRPANAVPTIDLERVFADDADPATVRVGVRTAAGVTAFTVILCLANSLARDFVMPITPALEAE